MFSVKIKSMYQVSVEKTISRFSIETSTAHRCVDANRHKTMHRHDVED